MPTKKMEIKARQKAHKQAEKKQADPPSHEQIATLAERYWLERGRPVGSPEEDWLRAERELRAKAS